MRQVRPLRLTRRVDSFASVSYNPPMSWKRIPADKQEVALDECPFCRTGETYFLSSDKPPFLQIVHYPLKGVVCPARMEQVCDSQAQGASWWNDRTPKKGVEET